MAQVRDSTDLLLKYVDVTPSQEIQGYYHHLRTLTFKGWEFRIENKATYTGKGGSSVYGMKPQNEVKLFYLVWLI